jgi:hypothetical protein
MSEGIDLSVVIVNWNVKALLAKCLRSLMDAPGWQLIPPDGEAAAPDGRAMEIWVVDSASSDGSAEMVRQDFPGAGLIANTENVGFTRGNNQGIARCRGRAILLLNPDTEVLGDALGVMLEYLDAHPDAGVAGPRITTPDGGVQPSRRRFPTYATAFVESTCLQQWFPRHPLLARYYMWDAPDDREQDVDWLEGACLLARTEAVQQVGGLDERFFMYSEELDWCQRIKAAGWRVVYLPQAQILHYGGKSSDQVAAAKHIHFQRSKIAYYTKYFGRFRGGLLRGFLLATYAWMLAEESAKWLVGHKRSLRAERIAAYSQVLRSGLR